MTKGRSMRVIACRVDGRTVLRPWPSEVRSSYVTFFADVYGPLSYWPDFANAAGQLVHACANAARHAAQLDDRLRVMHAPSFAPADVMEALDDALAWHGSVYTVRLSDNALDKIRDL